MTTNEVQELKERLDRLSVRVERLTWVVIASLGMLGYDTIKSVGALFGV